MDKVWGWVLNGRSTTHPLESDECSSVSAEWVGFQTAALEQADEEIAKRRRVVGGDNAASRQITSKLL